MAFDPPINPKTGKCDGLYYTFGKDEVSLVLAHLLMNNSNPKTFHRVSAKLTVYTNGLRTLAQLPRESAHLTKICLAWRDKNLEEFKTMLTKEEGQTFLLNLAHRRYREILLRGKNE